MNQSDNMIDYANQLLRNIEQMNSGKIPVVYVGLQKSMGFGDDFHLVNEISGSTIAYNPTKHVIVGSHFGVAIPEELRGNT